MGKECPSCHRSDVGEILQCNSCGMMYCIHCELGLQHIMSFPFALDSEAFVPCPDCGCGGEIVSSDDDEDRYSGDSSYSDSEFSDSNESRSETAFSYSSYNGSPINLQRIIFLSAIYFLIPVTIASLAEYRHLLGYFTGGFPGWFFLGWPVAVAMTIFLSALELLTVIFGGPASNLEFLFGVLLPCAIFWAILAAVAAFIQSTFLR